MTVFRKRIFAIFLIILFMVSTYPGSANAVRFSDVNIDHWAYSSIEWGASKGIIQGYPDGSFRPNNPVTEAQFITLLSRFDCSGDNTYLTQPGESFAAGTYHYFKNKNMPLLGLADSTLRNQSITRGQVARVIAAFNGYDFSLPYAVNYMYKENLSNGLTEKKDYQDYGADLTMTRAQAAAFFERLAEQGSCDMIGLKQDASGKDDARYPLPLNFLGNETIIFPPLKGDSKETSDDQVRDIVIEKGELIANGVDSTFVTASLNDCNGKAIPYEDSLEFQVTSAKGARIETGEYQKPYSSTAIRSDGPDVTVKVTAPRSDKVVKDKITIMSADKSGKMACYRDNPITVQLNYEPQPELRLQLENSHENMLPVEEETRLTATVVLPGGEIATNFSGRVRFHSDKYRLSNTEAVLYNGRAATYIGPVQSSGLLADDITAEIIDYDAKYEKVSKLRPILNKKHRLEVYYEPNLQLSCPKGDEPEIAFILDSSGSMKQNDPERLRVDKSQELLYALYASDNIGAEFNNKASILGVGDPWSVAYSLYGVGASGGTNIKAGLEKAFNQFSPDSSRKVAVLVTDGKSNEKQALQMIEKAWQQGITIYTVGLGNQVNESLLQRLAHETGGEYYHVKENIQLGKAYQSILDQITCGGAIGGSCSYTEQMFIDPTVKITDSDIYMNTFLENNCSVARVVVRFNSFEGDIDYELVHRGQNYYAIKRGSNEISDFNLLEDAQILAYSSYGYLIANRDVSILKE